MPGARSSTATCTTCTATCRQCPPGRASCAAALRAPRAPSASAPLCSRAPSLQARSGPLRCGRATTWPNGSTSLPPPRCSSLSALAAFPSPARTWADSSTIPSLSSSCAGTRWVRTTPSSARTLTSRPSAASRGSWVSPTQSAFVRRYARGTACCPTSTRSLPQPTSTACQWCAPSSSSSPRTRLASPRRRPSSWATLSSSSPSLRRA
mmetsp:Transcript_20344/g.54766  ORF Transcript_20344/g.54766 Transcript_20344/m.54766 type:complete len:208 (+) Transcript_20344:1156-1779(+)